MPMTQTSRFIEEVAPLAQRVADDGGGSAAHEGGSGSADYIFVSHYYLRINIGGSYRMTIGLLTEMPQIIEIVRLDTADLAVLFTLCKSSDRNSMSDS